MTFITTLLGAITSGITGIMSPIIEGIKTGFKTLIYVNPTAETLVVSDLAYFLFAMLGISIGVGLVWLCISLFKRRA